MWSQGRWFGKRLHRFGKEEKMRVLIIGAALFLCMVMLTVSVGVWSCLAQEGVEAEKVSVNDLINRIDHYDGRRVIIEGEAIGDLMRRGGYSWITVNDDAYSEKCIEEGGDFAGYSNIGIGVWVESGQAEAIRHLESYKTKGDRVRVNGVFHRVCAEQGGDTDIHAESLLVLQEGHEIEHPLNHLRLLVLLVMLAVSGGL